MSNFLNFFFDLKMNIVSWKRDLKMGGCATWISIIRENVASTNISM